MWQLLHSQHFFTFELFIFLRALQSTVSGLAVTLLVQDKICINRYAQSVAFCTAINVPAETVAEQTIKNHILADSTLFGNYRYLLECIPVFLWSLFVGSFLDVFHGGTRLLFTISIIGSLIAVATYFINELAFTWSPYLLLVASGTYWITGGQASYMTVTYRYIVLNSTESFRPIKFMLFQFAIVTGLSLGTFTGGQLLMLIPSSSSHPSAPFRTYYLNFAVHAVIDVISLALVTTLKPSNNTPKREESEDDVLTDSHSSRQHFLSLLLNFENIRQTFHCFFKCRPDRKRLQICLLYSILFGQVLIFFGNQDVFFQFTEKVYHWDPTVYANYASISTLVTTTLMTLATVLLVQRWHFPDETLLLIALISSFGGQLVMGTFYTPHAYIASLFIGSLSGFAAVTIRNKISRIVPKDELGRIFAVGQTIEAVMPFLGSVIFSHLFTWTISTWPGLIYQFSALLVLLSMLLFIAERVYCV